MVRHDDDRTFLGNSRNLIVRREQLDVEQLEAPAPEALPGRSARSLEFSDKPHQRGFARQPFDHANCNAPKGIRKRTGIRKIAAIVRLVIRVARKRLAIIIQYRKLPQVVWMELRV